MQQDSMQPSGATHKPALAPDAPSGASAEGVGDAARLRWMRRVLRVMAAASLVSLLLALAFAPRLVSTAALVLTGSCLLLVVIDIGQTRAAGDLVRVLGQQGAEPILRQPEDRFVVPEGVVGIETDRGDPHGRGP